MKAFRARLAKLERQIARPGALVYESMEAARRAGATGGVLILAPFMDPDEWCRVARLQQSRLTSGAE